MDINDAWKSACRTVLGDEVGDLERYRGYLAKYVPAMMEKESAISGKKVSVAKGRYCSTARFMGNEEIAQYENIMRGLKLEADEIKDFDSLVESVRERLYYCGNIALGNSSNVEKSNSCSDSSHVYESYLIRNGSKYVAYSSRIREAEFTFGSMDGGETKFLIKGYAPYKVTRCMEVLRTKPISDCYYSANIQGCTNCMFSFNLRNAHYAIGNRVLQKDEYMKLKEKLLEDIRTTMMEKKGVPTIIEIMGAGSVDPSLLAGRVPATGRAWAADAINERNGLARMEAAFQTITLVLFGKRLSGLRSYSAWLEEYNGGSLAGKSAVSDSVVYAPDLNYYHGIMENFVTLDEALDAGGLAAPPDAVAALNLANAAQKIGKIAFYTPEVIAGRNANVMECGDYQNSSDVLGGSFVFDTKESAYSFFPKLCESVFGTDMLLKSRHCMRCCSSINLTRCFEVLYSSGCSDCYFCQNCENLQNCMFCFNAKGLRYAIGNVEVGKEEYERIRKLVLADIVKRLEKDRRLDLNIYNCGCGKE